MNISRREFLQMLAVAGASGISLPACGNSSAAKKSTSPYELPAFGNVSLMHYTDCHAQLMPIYFREPSINLGIGPMKGKPPHLVGDKFLSHYGIKPGSRDAHALTYLNFAEAARQFGQVGGFAHLSTLVKNIRAQRPGSLLLDGGDTWQGSGTSYWTDV